MEGSNVLEGSKDCRSVGGHGNQHVRLRSAEVSLSGVTGPVQEAIFAFEMRRAPEGPICKRKESRTSRRSSRRGLSCLPTVIDPAARTVRLAGGATLSYDRLVVTPGSTIRDDAIEGYDAMAMQVMLHAWKAAGKR